MNGLKLFHYSPTVTAGAVNPLGHYNIYKGESKMDPGANPTAGPNTFLARRKLFVGSSDQSSKVGDLKTELLKQFSSLHRAQSEKWNFDFARETPLPGPYAWSRDSTVTKRRMPTTNSHDRERPIKISKISHLYQERGVEEVEGGASPYTKFFQGQPSPVEPCLSIECQSCTSRLSNGDDGLLRITATTCYLQTKITDYFPTHKKTFDITKSVLTPPDTILKSSTTHKRFSSGSWDETEGGGGADDCKTLRCNKRLAFQFPSSPINSQILTLNSLTRSLGDGWGSMDTADS